MSCACRYEVEKLTASQRLDLNLEKGRMRDELQVCLTAYKANVQAMKLSAQEHACRLLTAAELLRCLHNASACTAAPCVHDAVASTGACLQAADSCRSAVVPIMMLRALSCTAGPA